MIEINRFLYMDENTGEKLRRFSDIVTIIDEFIVSMMNSDFMGGRS